MLGESTCGIIDLDESKFRIEDQNRKFGKVVREKRCNTTGNYINGSQGVDLLMAIYGDERIDQRRIQICGSSTIIYPICATGWQSIVRRGYFYSRGTI